MIKVYAVGNLSKDIETRYTNDGKPVVHTSIAINRKFKRDNEPDADFFNLVAFGKTAETMEKYLHKGSKIAIDGVLQNNNYTNKEGKTVYRDVIVVNLFDFCDSKGSGAAANNSNADDRGFVPARDLDLDWDNMSDNDLPFV